MESNKSIDPLYERKVSGYLKKAVAGLICAAFPVASIVAICLGAGNHREIVNYVASGGMHTAKIKTCAALSKGAIFAGIGMTAIYAFIFFFYVLLIVLAIGFSTLPNQS